MSYDQVLRVGCRQDASRGSGDPEHGERAPVARGVTKGRATSLLLPGPYPPFTGHGDQWHWTCCHDGARLAQIETTNGRGYMLCADTPGDQDEWTRVLSANIAALPPEARVSAVRCSLVRVFNSIESRAFCLHRHSTGRPATRLGICAKGASITRSVRQVAACARLTDWDPPKPSDLALQGYKKRFFALKGRQLLYFRSQEDASELGTISLSQISDICEGTPTSNPKVFYCRMSS